MNKTLLGIALVSISAQLAVAQGYSEDQWMDDSGAFWTDLYSYPGSGGGGCNQFDTGSYWGGNYLSGVAPADLQQAIANAPDGVQLEWDTYFEAEWDSPWGGAGSPSGQIAGSMCLRRRTLRHPRL